MFVVMQVSCLLNENGTEEEIELLLCCSDVSLWAEISTKTWKNCMYAQISTFRPLNVDIFLTDNSRAHESITVQWLIRKSWMAELPTSTLI